MASWGWGYFPRYVSVGERKRKAAKQLAAMVKKGAVLEPVSIEGYAIARSWWGAHWNRNLERYADYANRLGRGRSYVRHGAVLDLKIEKGRIDALVAGSGRKPYKVSVQIKPLEAQVWKTLVDRASGRIETVAGLLEGRFPEELAGLFFSEKEGLFPRPREIRLDCSCPDAAGLCKHLAAVLYGTGARLDKAPDLFFTLRGVDVSDLAGRAAAHATGRLLSKAASAGKGAKKGRILQATGPEGISGLFGIAMQERTADPVRPRPAAAETPAERPSRSKMRTAAAAERRCQNGAGPGRGRQN